MKIYIYCIYFPTSKRTNPYYVGQTQNLEKRMQQHLRSDRLVCKALYKYDDWQVSILHIRKNRDEANLLEIECIRNSNCIAPNGYNLTAGGDGGDTFTNNPNKEEIRRAMLGNKKFKNHKHTEEAKERIKKNHKGFENHKHSEESIEKIRSAHQGECNPFYGKHHSEKQKKK